MIVSLKRFRYHSYIVKQNTKKKELGPGRRLIVLFLSFLCALSTLPLQSAYGKIENLEGLIAYRIQDGAGAAGTGGGSALNSGSAGAKSTTNPGDSSGGAGGANTGGGGGGAGQSQYLSYTGTGGAGGSGSVTIRYADTYDAAVSTTGSPTVTVSGGFRNYRFTGSGSITF